MPATPPETAGREDQSLVVAVAPVRSGRGLPMPLRVLGVALVVGVIAFLAGNHAGGGPAAGLPEPTAAPSHSSAPPSPPSAAAATSQA